MTQPAPRILVVDDEEDIRTLIGLALSRMGLNAVPVETIADAMDLLAKQSFDLCLTDMRLPDGNGISLVEHIQQTYPQTPVAVITAYGNTQAAVDSLKAGAFDFVSKPLQSEQLRRLVDTALKLAQQPAGTVAGDEELLGDSAVMQELRGMVARMARSQAPLHIHGESGTGKERVARLVHASGPRADGPFVPVNCGAIPSELMESEFFGHVRGSFTGATRDKTGLFQSAEGGTLFLDEVAELPLHMQVKLLRAVQERSVRPVGGDSEAPFNARIISATNEHLSGRVAAREFRQDLYYRLNVVSIQTPALREHAEDIPLLATHILGRIARRNGMAEVPTLCETGLQALKAYAFPGNVRELENILERAVTLCDGQHITPADLHMESAPSSAPSAAKVEATNHANAATPAETPAGAPGGTLAEQLEAMERKAIEEALHAARWNRTRAAQALGLTFRQLRYKIKKLGIE